MRRLPIKLRWPCNVLGWMDGMEEGREAEGREGQDEEMIGGQWRLAGRRAVFMAVPPWASCRHWFLSPGLGHSESIPRVFLLCLLVRATTGFVFEVRPHRCPSASNLKAQHRAEVGGARGPSGGEG